MHRNYVITDLHIPYDILQDKRFTLEEKFLMAIETQYPKILREDIASIMNITIRQVSNHRNSINKKLKEEINFPKEEQNFPKREENFLNDEESIKEEENFLKREENFLKREENFPKTNADTNGSKPSRGEKRKAWVHYQNLINGLKTYEEYESSVIELSKLKTETLLTQNQIETLRKMLSQKLQKLKN